MIAASARSGPRAAANQRADACTRYAVRVTGVENAEVVDGLHWLWSDASSFYNGQELVLDSGLTQAMVTPTLYQQDVGAMMAALAPADPAKEL